MGVLFALLALLAGVASFGLFITAIVLFFTNRRLFPRIAISSVGSFVGMIVLFIFAGITMPDLDTEEAAQSEEEETEDEEIREEEEEETSDTDEGDEEENEESRDDESEPEIHEIDFDSTIEIGEEEVVIEGETNFDDGTVLEYHVINYEYPDDAVHEEIEIEDSGFNETVDVESFSDGEIEVIVGFYPFAQTDELMEKYGEEGQYIENDDIDEYGEIRFTETAVNDSPVELNGNGDEAIETFNLQAGFAVVDVNHDGESNFAVELKDDYGGQELLVNEIGDYDGETFAVIPAEDDYHLDINADGSWDAEITQTMPEDEDIESEEEQIEGSGDSVVFVEMEGGSKRFEFTHDGESNFAVLLNGVELLVNDIGSYEGSQSQNVADDDIYAFVITADGSWTLDID